MIELLMFCLPLIFVLWLFYGGLWVFLKNRLNVFNWSFIVMTVIFSGLFLGVYLKRGVVGGYSPPMPKYILMTVLCLSLIIILKAIHGKLSQTFKTHPNIFNLFFIGFIVWGLGLFFGLVW